MDEFDEIQRLVCEHVASMPPDPLFRQRPLDLVDAEGLVRGVREDFELELTPAALQGLETVGELVDWVMESSLRTRAA